MKIQQLLALICILPVSLCAQKMYHHSITLNSINDSYTLTAKDGYYTNGLDINYEWTSEHSSIIRRIHVGQDMYNAENGSYNELYKVDRPITAYLYVGYGQSHFLNDGMTIFQWSADVSTIGPNAQGKNVQEWMHRTLGMYHPNEWQFQLRNGLGLDISALWSQQMIETPNAAQLAPVLKTKIGLNETNLNAGLALQLGKTQKAVYASAWGTALNKTNADQKESYFYVYPQLQLNGYNATVQGRLLNTKPEIYKGKLNVVQNITEMGYLFAHKSFLFNLGLIYESKESVTQRKNQLYGKIRLTKSF